MPDTFPTEIADSRLQRLMDYWSTKRGPYRATRRIDIDPIEIPWILPYAWLYDFETETGRLRCRLAGESVRNSYRVNIIGLYLDQFLNAEDWSAIRVTHRKIVDGPAIGYSRGRVYRPNLGRTGHVERLILPLTDETGERVIMLFGATIYSVGLVTAENPSDPNTIAPRIFPIV